MLKRVEHPRERLAAALLMEYESRLRYYEDQIRKMPLPVLRGHDTLISDRDLISLNAAKLTYEQRAAIEYLHAQWLLEADPVRPDVCYQVIATARGRCALCGATGAKTSHRSR